MYAATYATAHTKVESERRVVSSDQVGKYMHRRTMSMRVIYACAAFILASRAIIWVEMSFRGRGLRDSRLPGAVGSPKAGRSATNLAGARHARFNAELFGK